MKGMPNCTIRDKGMHASEDSIDSSVAASSVPPTFNDFFVISVCDKAPLSSAIVHEASNKKECNSLCPSDVPLPVEGLPSGNEAPCSPVLADGDGDADF